MQTISKDNSVFPTLRQSGCLYGYKTAWFLRLATDRGAYFFFLARTRRFGKSPSFNAFANGRSASRPAAV